MAITSNTYTGNGSNKLFSITFPYLETSDIDVYLNGTLQTITTQYFFANATTVEFVAAPANGATVKLDRSTDDSDNPATFFPGSSIKAADLNENFDQTLYVVQEINNNAVKLADPLYANKTYIDAADATKVNKSGDTMSGNLAMGGNRVTGLGTPSVDADSATKLYVDQRYGQLGVPGLTRWRKIATAGQTVFSGVGEDSNTLAYSASRESVFINGAYQQRGVDYTANNGTSITITPALLAGDVVDVHCVNNAAGVATDQSSGVYFTQSGVGAATRTVDSKLKEVVSVKDFGAIGDGVANDTAAFIAAYTAKPGCCILIPEPTIGYKITSLLTIPANTIFRGDTRHKTKILHSYNGDFANLGDGAGFENCHIDGQGATYTGGCFVFTGTNGGQYRVGVRVSDFDGPIESFEVGAGSQSIALDVRYSRRNAGTGTNRFAFVISATQQLSAIPRKFLGVETDGTCAFDFGGCNNVYITNSFLGDLKFTPDSRAVLISSTRIANQTALTVDGHNISFSSCDIAPQITIAVNADAVVIQGSSFNNLPITDNSNNRRNILSTWATAYTPTLSSGGTPPTIGNGSISGVVARLGGVTHIVGELALGSTTSLGTGGLSVSLPQKRHDGSIFVGGTVAMNRGGTIYQGFMQIAGAVTTASLLRDTTGSITFNSPGVFATGDTIRWSATYTN